MAEVETTAPESSPAPAKSGGGMDPKLVALLSWIFAPISSIVFMLLEDTKNDEFSIYNAKLSLFFTIAQIVITIVLMVLMVIPVVGLLMGCLNWLLQIGLLVYRIILAVKSYNGEKVEVPLLSDWMKKM